MSVEPEAVLRTTTQPCELHSKHHPTSHVNHRHHIWPQGKGGPNISDNIVVVCPTGHYNIHDLMEQYIMLGGDVSWPTLKRYSFEERKYAKLGYERIIRKAM